LKNEFKLKEDIKNRFKELFEEGALSELNYLEKISEINSLEGEIVENEINLKRQKLKYPMAPKMENSLDLKEKECLSCVKGTLETCMSK